MYTCSTETLKTKLVKLNHLTEFVSTINSMGWDFGDEALFGGGECHRVQVWHTCTALRYKPAFLATW